MRTFGAIPYGVDINQLGASEFPRFSISQPSPYADGLVEDIILNETHPQYAVDGSNIGDILVRMIPDDRGVPKERLNWASPLESNIQNLPLKNETVLIFYSFGKLYYTRSVNTTKKITESSWPGLSQRFSPIPTNQKSDSAQLAAQGGPSYQPSEPTEPFTLGNEFKENINNIRVRSSEGDVILQSRFGSVIRFGSSLFSNPTTVNPQPNLLITVGQGTPTELSTPSVTPFSLTYESVNNDQNSIWITTDETVPFLAATAKSTSDRKAHLRSVETPTSRYSGVQVIVNSDRLVLNSKKNEISLFANTQINLSSLGGLTLDTEKSIYLTANNIISISGEKIFIGSEGATEPMVLGNQLATFLEELISTFSSSTGAVISSAPGTPAPFSPALIAQLTKLKSKLSTPQFNSQDNFVSKQNSIKIKNNNQLGLIQTQTIEAQRASQPFTFRKSLMSTRSPSTVLGRYNNR